MPEHSRPDEIRRPSPIGDLLLQDGPSVDRRVEDLAAALVRRTLAMRDHPGEDELARVTATLLDYLDVLERGLLTVPPVDLCARGRGALEVLARLRAEGPSSSPLGTWSYPRHLALCARDMLTAIREHRAAAPFIGRPDRPPVAPASR
ncbi:hypothetical protein GCM10010363_07570 [Streptomyces omiyaensis]|uniref:hypothetical protein n=1 Tax=Streptomyces omiyaensis TaxID=68247 RepID=UPI0016727141|nr:hypothetical protein [Streptomyces omiyaensis]GGY29618.1 hypothetical protein GCM10010363_07570 [Streptomyces omiyaensis]